MTATVKGITHAYYKDKVTATVTFTNMHLFSLHMVPSEICGMCALHAMSPQLPDHMAARQRVLDAVCMRTFVLVCRYYVYGTLCSLCLIAKYGTLQSSTVP